MAGSTAKIIGGVLLLVSMAVVAGIGSFVFMIRSDNDIAESIRSFGADDKVHTLDEEPAAEDGSAGGKAGAGDQGAATADAQGGSDFPDEGDLADGDTGAVDETDAKSEQLAERREGKGRKRGKLSKAERRAKAAQRDGSRIRGRPEPKQTAKTAKKKGKSLAECAAIVTTARQNSKTSVTLSEAFLDTYVRDLSKGQQQGWAGWAKDSGGKRMGVRVKSLRCAPRTAGLRNKDIVTSIGGHKIVTTANAYLAYNKVKKGEDFDIELVRKGQPLTIRYTVGAVAPPAAQGSGEGEAAAADAAPAEGGASDAAAPEGSAAEGAAE